jgi:hypothetical protein
MATFRFLGDEAEFQREIERILRNRRERILSDHAAAIVEQAFEPLIDPFLTDNVSWFLSQPPDFPSRTHWRQFRDRWFDPDDVAPPGPDVIAAEAAQRLAPVVEEEVPARPRKTWAEFCAEVEELTAQHRADRE